MRRRVAAGPRGASVGRTRGGRDRIVHDFRHDRRAAADPDTHRPWRQGRLRGADRSAQRDRRSHRQSRTGNVAGQARGGFPRRVRPERWLACRSRRRSSEATLCSKSERALARGAVAYITSHEADARTLLGAIDPDGLDARLAGQVAFARSVLETGRDRKAAVSLLDWARLLAPGGLVEEAALRREIALLAEARDAPRAARLAHEYADPVRRVALCAGLFPRLRAPHRSERPRQRAGRLPALFARGFRPARWPPGSIFC